MNKQELRSGYQPTVDKPIGTPPSGDSSVQMDNEDRNKPHSIRAAAWTPAQEPEVGGRLYSALLGAVLGLCLGGAIICGLLGRAR